MLYRIDLIHKWDRKKISAMNFQQKMYYLCYNKKNYFLFIKMQYLLYKIKYKQ